MTGELSMTGEDERAGLARALIDRNSYMTLGTADSRGQPWVSPVWYAFAGYEEFFWVSDPDARHSRNLATRPQLGAVIFDSQVPVGAAQAVYMSAIARELGGAELERGIEVFSGRSRALGARAWTPEDVRPPAVHRLYGATASELFVLDGSDRRLAVRL